jgi:hypothetical protein
MPVLPNTKHEKFAQLVARGESITSAYVAAGYREKGARANGARLLAKDYVRARVLELQEKVSESLVAQSIAVKEARLRAANDRWLKMHTVIQERGSDPEMKDVPGGKTGLLCHDRKGVGSGDAAEVIDVYQVDTGLLKEMRELEQQAAKELGQWVEKGEYVADGPCRFVIEGVSKAEWLPKKDSSD